MIRLYVWGGVPACAALARVPLDRLRLRRERFGRLVGTARGFEPGSADPSRWLAVVDAGEAFEGSAVVRGWDALATERARLLLAPLAARGSWGRRTPFTPVRSGWRGPVVALTHARLDPWRGRRFRRAVPAVAAQLSTVADVRWSAGFGAWPVGVAGTLSVWPSPQALRSFSDSGPHREVVARTPAERWYAEELFARFALLGADGQLDGRPTQRLLTTGTLA